MVVGQTARRALTVFTVGIFAVTLFAFLVLPNASAVGEIFAAAGAENVAPPSPLSPARLALWPHLYIIGVQKAGSSSLHHILSEHPGVGVAYQPAGGNRGALVPRAVGSVVKEVNFWTRDFGRGPSYYDSWWRPEDNGLVKVDATIQMITEVRASQRLRWLVPDARMVVMLRDPVDLLYSEYQMNLRNGMEERRYKTARTLRQLWDAERAAMEKALKRETRSGGDGIAGWSSLLEVAGAGELFSGLGYIGRGLYAEQLAAWLRLWPRSQLHVIRSEDFYAGADSARRVMRGLEAFAGLAPFDYTDEQLADATFPVPTENYTAPHDYPPMEPALRSEMTKWFAPFNRDLEALLGRSFDWPAS